jgi:fatty acid desaturase
MVLHISRRVEDRTLGLAETAREAFWTVAICLIGCYAFFVVLGAFSPGDVVGVTVGIGILAVLWVAHAVAAEHRARQPDPRLSHTRERRGF